MSNKISAEAITPKLYSLRDRAAVSAVAASGVLTSDNTQVTAGKKVTIGTIIYTFVAALTKEVAASGVLTSDNTQVTAGKKVTIGDIEYTFVAALTTDPDTVPYEVLIGADADGTLNNLIAAINGAEGEGTTYGTGTVAHPDVTAGTVAAHAFTVTAKVTGVDGNSIAKAEDDAHLDWDGAGATLTGGLGGTARVTLTSNNTNVADGVTVTIGSKVYTFRTNLTTNPKHVPYEVKIGANANASLTNLIAAINGSAGAGVTYSSGTDIHPDVTAGALDGTNHTVVLYAKARGSSYNSIGVSDSSATLSWSATTLTGGISEIPYEVVIGADADGTLANLKAAINGAAGEGTTYANGTDAHPLVTCGNVTAHAVTVTAKTAGTAGNAIAKAEDDAHLDWDGTGETLTGGVDAVANLDPEEEVGGEGGFASKIIADAPAMDGTTTYTLAIKRSDGDAVYTSSALNESALSVIDLADKPLRILPTDKIVLTPSNAQTDTTITVELR